MRFITYLTDAAWCKRAPSLGARGPFLFLIVAPVESQAGAPAAAAILNHAPQILIVPIEAPPLYFDFTAGAQEAAKELGIAQPRSAIANRRRLTIKRTI
jgi:hypothetical protein